MHALKTLAAAGGVVAACLVSGCTLLVLGGAGAGAAGYAYVKGENEKVYPCPLSQTLPAVRAAVQETGLPVVSEAADDLGARLESRTSQGDKVTITLEPKGPSVTNVRIRVGVFGDEDASRLILGRIDQLLPGAHPEVHVGVSVSR